METTASERRLVSAARAPGWYQEQSPNGRGSTEPVHTFTAGWSTPLILVATHLLLADNQGDANQPCSCYRQHISSKMKH